jgi:REP element-mobilizing transposase RayT
MLPKPFYSPTDLQAAYQLRYSWTGWPSSVPFPTADLPSVLSDIAPEWEKDGLRVLESALAPDRIQITLSASPQIAPVTLAARVKGRIQHHCRLKDRPINFSRKVSVRSLGDATRNQVEAYVRNQVANEPLADEKFRETLWQFTVQQPHVDLSLATVSNSGQYWYNLHLVLVTRERYRVRQLPILANIRDGALRICEKKGYLTSTLAVMPDHLHISLRGTITQSPEEIALAFLNNLAHLLDGRLWWAAGYYAGTFGEYGMAAVRGEKQGAKT